MNADRAVHRDYERTLLRIARVLPSDRVGQLVDFARFLEAQLLGDELIQGVDLAEIASENAEWDAVMATDEAQTLLDTLADEALAKHRAGKTRSMAFDQGRIVPG